MLFFAVFAPLPSYMAMTCSCIPFAFAFARSSPSETASPRLRSYEDMGKMAADATHNPALQCQKFTDKLRGFVFPFCTRCYLGSSKVRWENVVYKMSAGGDHHGESVAQ